MNQLQHIRTMSSLEIADLTRKNHKDILRDIRQMVKTLDGANLRCHCESGSYQNKQDKKQPLFRLDKETTLTLLSGYDVVARHKIVTRWSQLEKERQEEEANPELAIRRGQDRAVKTWKGQDKSDKWIDERMQGMSTRKSFTSTLAKHGVKQQGYRNCTNAIYTPLFGGTTEVIRSKKNLPVKSNIRDNMTAIELGAIRLAELMAEENIETRKLSGNGECELACTTASKHIAEAIKGNRKATI